MNVEERENGLIWMQKVRQVANRPRQSFVETEGTVRRAGLSLECLRVEEFCELSGSVQMFWLLPLQSVEDQKDVGVPSNPMTDP